MSSFSLNVVGACLAVLLSSGVSVLAGIGDGTDAVDRSRFQIGAYRLQTCAQTEEHVRELRDCGLDYVAGIVSATPEERMRVLDLFDRYGLYAVVSGVLPELDAYRNRFTEANVPLSKYGRAAETWRELGYARHRSAALNYVGDEMPGTDFPHLGRVVACLRRQLPGVQPYVNLYPSYAMPNFKPGMTNYEQIVMRRLGARNYRAYIDLYCRQVPLDYISYDFYLYAPADDTFLPFLYENYEIVADACRRTGRSFWFMPQVNSIRPAEWTSANRLRFQAFSAMAYGCENLHWACYTAGWWTNQVVDASGRKTEQYEKLKTVNAEIRRLAGPYMAFRNVATEYVGFTSQPKALEKIGVDKAVASASFAPFEEVRAEDGGPLLVGEMMPRCTSSCTRALFVCAADDPYDRAGKNRRVRFRAAGCTVHAVGAQRDIEPTVLADGTCEVPLVSNAAVLLVAE